MNDRLHIIITGDKGKVQNFLLSRRMLYVTGLLSACLFIFLCGASYKAFHLLRSHPLGSREEIASLNTQLTESLRLKEELARQVSTLQQENDSLAQQSRKQEKIFQEEKTALINSAVSELEERSNLMERIMYNIGVDIDDLPKNNSHSGGPFIAPGESGSREILFRSDHYLESINSLPLGRPVPGPVTSRFGGRVDPVNGKKGYHTGVDMRGRSGQKVTATADGIVKKAFTNGSYGLYIEIDHGNGYTTKFAHMKKLMVKRGDHVKRGQQIGAIGSTGRSTGPHLHYEVCRHDKPVNPSKFMRVDKLATTPVIPRLSQQSHKKIKRTASAAGREPSA